MASQSALKGKKTIDDILESNSKNMDSYFTNSKKKIDELSKSQKNIDKILNNINNNLNIIENNNVSNNNTVTQNFDVLDTNIKKIAEKLEVINIDNRKIEKSTREETSNIINNAIRGWVPPETADEKTFRSISRDALKKINKSFSLFSRKNDDYEKKREKERLSVFNKDEFRYNFSEKGPIFGKLLGG